MNKIVMIVLIVGVLAMIIGFSVELGLSVYKSNKLEKNTKFPPWPAKCPDYWTVGDDNTCVNVKGIGDCKSESYDNEMDFSDAIFKGTRGMYYKCNWAQKCKTPWEGIDNLC